jgi:hypothetical protein
MTVKEMGPAIGASSPALFMFVRRKLKGRLGVSQDAIRPAVMLIPKTRGRPIALASRCSDAGSVSIQPVVAQYRSTEFQCPPVGFLPRASPIPWHRHSAGPERRAAPGA